MLACRLNLITGWSPQPNSYPWAISNAGLSPQSNYADGSLVTQLLRLHSYSVGRVPSSDLATSLHPSHVTELLVRVVTPQRGGKASWNRPEPHILGRPTEPHILGRYPAAQWVERKTA